ncbi:MAG TPA: MMPL family transporter [Polyangia bacterium]|jgi:hypothetical protein
MAAGPGRMTRLMGWWAGVVTARPGLVLAVLGVITAGLAVPLLRAKVDSSLERAVSEDNPHRQYLEQARRSFQIEEPMVVGLEGRPHVFTPDFLARLERFTHGVERVPGVAGVRGLVSARTVRGGDGAISVERAVPAAAGATPAALAAARERAARDPLLRDVVSADGRATALIIQLQLARPGLGAPASMPASAPAAAEPDEIIAQRVTAAVAALAEESFGRDTPVHFGGLAYLRGKLVATIQHELRTIAVASGVVIALLLLLVFRCLAGLVIPLLTMAIATVWIMGGMTLCGKDIDVYTGMVPSLILIIGVLDAIHLLSDFQDEAAHRPTPREAVAGTIRQLGSPCLLNSITTSYGFASIMINPVPIIQGAGLVMAIGILVTFVVVIAFVPAILCFWAPPPLERDWREDSLLGRALVALGDWVVAHARPLTIGIVAVMLLVGFGISRLKVESEFVRYFKDDDPVARAGRFFDERMGGSVGFDLIVEGGPPNGALTPGVLAGMHRLAQQLRADARVTVVHAPTDAFGELKRALTGAATMPASREEAAQLLLLLEGEEAPLLEQLLTRDGARARLRVRTASLPSRTFTALAQQAQADAQKLLGVPVRATGQHLLMMGTADEIVDGQIWTFGLDCLGLVVILAIAFRSIGLGALALIPNVLPILGGLALMAAAGISLNNVTSINAAVGLGIAIDDTVHFIARYRTEEAESPALALRRTLLAVGRPMLLSTLVLSLGFGTLILSRFKNNSDTGVIASATLAIAIFGDLLLLPILLSLRRRRAEQRAARQAARRLGAAA